MIKGSEIRDLSDDELERRLEETREELFNLRFQHATGQLDNYRRLRELRRDVARIRTIARERELALQGEGSEEGAGRG
ncbi:MAG: 50S ribosomal protein L29 [Actinomycetota bacterium]|nr:50S ribosomal protein L29 [Actinomycetota bacterium]